MRIKIYLKTIRPEIQFVYFLCMMVGVVVSGGKSALFQPLTWVGVSGFLLVYFGCYFINAYADIDIDKINKPDRPSVKGEITKDELLTATFISYLSGLLIIRYVNFNLFVIGASIAFLGTIYSLKPLHLKSRHIFCTLTLVWAHTAAILGGAAIITLNNEFLWKVVFIQALIAFFVTFSKDIHDIEGDIKYGIKTLAGLLGEKKSKMFLLPLPFLPLLYLLVPEINILALLSVGFVWALYPLRKNRFLKTFVRSVKITNLQNILILLILLIH
ncbi:MAG: hypothetical protein DRP13_04250 [Candidatus Aenigmatarchaeota archaeon]|nr:MAG: hypothetical protein DRP18_04350 [Candidatus Aenigmarchaeota archaeon]RLJ07165.1 MAG: hypothetical protein DRP13_04250 [Candidatus Aenigmarchaeota archaeon]RLJ07465.1 MAG: hypothetical protein DRP16_03415 [Candidatus Aenigmarchaeota archaeon]